MKKTIKIIFPLLVVIITFLLVNTIMNNPPKAKRSKTKVEHILTVETQKILKKDFTVLIDSYGLSKASLQTTLLSQVSGKINYVNKNFINGAYFKKGALLLKVDDLEYKADVKIAQAEEILAKQALLEEEAKGKIAQENWEKYNANVKPSALVLRTPQLKAAQATLEAANAKLIKAKIALQRTKIRAPYEGRIIQADVNIADVVSSNTQLAIIYSTKNIEVRLPISNKNLRLMDTGFALKEKSLITLKASLTQKEYQAKIITREAKIDSTSKQAYLLARIFNEKEDLLLSQYLEAKIPGNTIKNAIIIPNASIYQGKYVYIEKKNFLYRKDITILWQDDEKSLITKGLNQNDNLVLTRLGLVSSGTKVKLSNKVSKNKNERN